MTSAIVTALAGLLIELGKWGQRLQDKQDAKDKLKRAQDAMSDVDRMSDGELRESDKNSRT